VSVDGYDKIEVSSIDSFPASDPPGWIEAKPHPCEITLAKREPDQSRQRRPRG
jgi:hypothetical protein